MSAKAQRLRHFRHAQPQARQAAESISSKPDVELFRCRCTCASHDRVLAYGRRHAAQFDPIDRAGPIDRQAAPEHHEQHGDIHPVKTTDDKREFFSRLLIGRASTGNPIEK